MMQAVNLNAILNIGSRAIVRKCNAVTIRTYYKKPFSYENIYRGKFDYHDQIKYPRQMNPYKEEELLDDVHTIKRMPIDKPSPFHIVKRIRGNAISIKGWHQWVTLRRLNLHSSKPGDLAIIPNTPQFNSLIAKVKHLLTITPAIMPDGRIPSEKDIGAVKVCPATGKVTIDEKLRLLAKRKNEQPCLWRGNQMRQKLKSMVRIHR